MKDILRRLTGDLESREFEVWSHAFSDVALLLERHALDRYDDPIYQEAFSTEALLDHFLDQADIDRFTACLVKVLRTEEDRAASAAWALGKTYDAKVSNELSAALEAYIEANNDEVVYQLIIALENCDKEKSSSFIAKLSKSENLNKSAEYAKQVLSLHS